MTVDGDENDAVENQIEEVVLTKKKVAKMVEQYVREYDMTYTDALLTICEERAIDPADAGSMVLPVIRDKIEAEALESRTIKGTENQLPV